jgi:hypothetical protein
MDQADLPGADPGPPHDVLAADAFALGAADPKLHEEPPHDILAAEAFALGVADETLHREPVHDVLAAEEFAVPGARPKAVPPDFPERSSPGLSGRPAVRRLVIGGALLVGFRLARRRGRRGRRGRQS